MPIELVDVPEPLSPASARLGLDQGMIKSDAWRVLTAEIDRYCRGDLLGRSFLISGHRGAGKTTLVLNAYRQVRQERERREDVRPLLVQVNGPSLFRDPTVDGPPTPPPSPPPSGADPTAAARPASPQPAPEGARAPDADAPEQWQHALKQVVLALHRAVSEEMCLAHRQRGIEATLAGSSARLEWLELSAQLEMELFECPMPARLRELWERSGLLGPGALFQRATPGSPDQGMRELVALAGVCEAYCRVSGTYTEAQRRSESAARQAEASLAGSSSAQLLAPFASLLAGGLVGLGVQQAQDSGVAGLLAGITAALAAAAVFKYSSTRSSARTASRELSFMPDLSVRTLDRFVPLLVRRLVRAGLAPVFVVDELDKVPDLPDRMVKLVRELKQVFAETAFFCFITDRAYFEALRRDTSASTYPPSSTFFSHQLFVVYRHEDLHRYIRGRLRPVELPRP